jgi:hypothetical protein
MVVDDFAPSRDPLRRVAAAPHGGPAAESPGQQVRPGPDAGRHHPARGVLPPGLDRLQRRRRATRPKFAVPHARPRGLPGRRGPGRSDESAAGGGPGPARLRDERVPAVARPADGGAEGEPAGAPEGAQGGSHGRGRARPDPGRRGEPCSGFGDLLGVRAEVGAITDVRGKSCGSGAVRRSRRRRKRAGGASVGEEPTQQFLELLASAIVAGEAHVADRKTGGEPKSAERWGWRPRDFGTDEYGPAALQPRGKCVGWLGEDGSLLLEPGAAFAAAQRMARDQGTGLPIAKRTLWKRMAEKDLLASRDAARGRNTSAPPSPGAQDRAPPRAGALSP